MRASGSRANRTRNAERGTRNSRAVVDPRSTLHGSTRARSVPHSAFRVPRSHHRPLPCLVTPVSPRTAASGSTVRVTDVPTNTRSAPAAAIRSTSARLSIPLSATAGTPGGIRATSRSANPRSTAKVPRSRLFTPTAAGSTASASSSSASEWTSTSTPKPSPRAAAARARSPSGASARTIKSAALAPAARVSYSCSSSRMKSLRSTGRRTQRATPDKSSSVPPKWRSSVNTEIATAPPCSYARACCTGSRSSRITPAEGERRFTSAMTPTAGPASAGAKRRGSGAALARRANSRACGRKAAMRSRVALRMASRRLSCMLAFGRFSGRLGFGFRSGDSVPLTRRQREILDFISGQITAQGYAPSFEEIAQRFTFRSLATVHEHLTNLERKGYIRRAHNESRGIEVVPPRGQTGASELPLYGLVAAGEPIEAVSGSDTIAVPDELVPRRGRSYVLKGRGQSMIDEHIKDGDFIVVHERNQADNGQTVVALVQGSSATVKRFYREPGGWIRLEPANPAMTPLRLNERDVTVQGVVVGVIRRY